MRRVVLLACFCFVVSAFGGDFQTWLKQDKALRESVNAGIKIGDFSIKLPLGWVDKGITTNGLRRLEYIGAQASAEPPKIIVELSVEGGAARSRGDAAEAWPSKFSGWKTKKLSGLWAVQAQVPGGDFGGFLLVTQVPTTSATLTLTAHGPLAGEIGALLQGVRYAGTGQPIAPPGEGNERSRAASRIPQVNVLGDALGGSPLHPWVVKAREALDNCVDPAQDNYVTLLDTGADALLARIHLIRSAKHSIRIQTFILGNDEVGRLMMYELIQAAKRGVKVEFIMDHISSFRDVDLAACISTASPNLTFRHYRPSCKRIHPAPLQESLDFLIPNKTNQRMHNKVFIVDDVVLITGGRNIDNNYYAQSTTINFRDRDVMVVGPMVSYAVRSFEEYRGYKKSVRTARLKDVKKVIKKGKFRRRASRDDFELHGHFVDLEKRLADTNEVKRVLADSLYKVDFALFLADPPGKVNRRYTAWRRGTIARQLESVMKSAESSLFLQTPYLVLDGGMLKIFRNLRRSHPGIKLVASSNSFGATDNPVAYAANFKMRPAYIKAGITVYEYRQMPKDVGYFLPNYDQLLKWNVEGRGKGAVVQDNAPFMCIHAKALVVDDILAFVGSYNFDPRSISLNTEVGLLVQDARFAAEVKGAIKRDILPENSWVVAKRKEARTDRELARSMPPAASRKHINMWPFRHTSGYELKTGQEPVPPSVPNFYSNYRDIGPFPGARDEGLAMKKIVTSLATVLSGLVVPLL